MKNTGIARKIDKLGRIVIPMEARRTLGWDETTWIVISSFGSYVLLRGKKNTGIHTKSIPQDSPILQELWDIVSCLSDSDLLLALDILHRLAPAPISAPVDGE